VTNEVPTLETLWQYALRFRVEELFLDSKSGAFELEASEVRSAKALERLYLIAAIVLLYTTIQFDFIHLLLDAVLMLPRLRSSAWTFQTL
jgi:hypothetical protein